MTHPVDAFRFGSLKTRQRDHIHKVLTCIAMRHWIVCLILSFLATAQALNFNLGNLFGNQDSHNEDSDTILIGTPLPKLLRSEADAQRLAARM